jgi:hypothetical protein
VVGAGFSEGKARKILNRLVNVGAVMSRRGYRGVLEYKPKIPFPKDPRVLRSISDALQIHEISKTDSEFVAPKIGAGDIIKRVEFYWGAKANNISLVYYPYYLCNLKTTDGSRRIDMINAVKGNLIEL